MNDKKVRRHDMGCLGELALVILPWTLVAGLAWWVCEDYRSKAEASVLVDMNRPTDFQSLNGKFVYVRNFVLSDEQRAYTYRSKPHTKEIPDEVLFDLSKPLESRSIVYRLLPPTGGHAGQMPLLVEYAATDQAVFNWCTQLPMRGVLKVDYQYASSDWGEILGYPNGLPAVAKLQLGDHNDATNGNAVWLTKRVTIASVAMLACTFFGSRIDRRRWIVRTILGWCIPIASVAYVWWKLHTL